MGRCAIQIHVAQLLKADIGSVREYGVDGVVDVSGSGIVSKVAGKVSLMRTDRGILLKGRLHTEAEVTCSRCLALYRCPLDLNIEEEYFPTVDLASGAPVSSPGEPGCFSIDEHNVIDLTEAVRQYALLGIPMKPLCREDCAGLCPDCGCNLNLGQCGCHSGSVDPRWAVLAELTDKRKGTS